MQRHRHSRRGPGGLNLGRFSCAKGTNIYVKVLFLVVVNVNVTKCVLQKCQIWQICGYQMWFFQALNTPKFVFGQCSSPVSAGVYPSPSTPSTSRSRRLRCLGCQVPPSQFLATPMRRGKRVTTLLYIGRNSINNPSLRIAQRYQRSPELDTGHFFRTRPEPHLGLNEWPVTRPDPANAKMINQYVKCNENTSYIKTIYENNIFNSWEANIGLIFIT